MQHEGKNRHAGDVAVSAATRLMNDKPANTAITQNLQGSIRAEFVGSNKCVALGLVAKGYSPGLELCRRLVAAGYDPALPLHIYRGEMLCLTVRSIGVGAQFAVEDDR